MSRLELKARELLDALCAIVPEWHFVEVAGPIGSGKSTLCEQISNMVPLRAFKGVEYDNLSRIVLSRSFDRFVDIFPPSMRYKIRKKIVKRTSRKSVIGNGRIWGEWRDVKRIAPSHLISFLQALIMARAVISECQNRNKIGRVVFDEGLVKGTIDFLSLLEGEGGEILAFVERALERCPGERTVVFIDASVEECLRRQRTRGLMVARTVDQQQRWQRSSDLVRELCEKSGWTVVTINNEVPAEAQESNSDVGSLVTGSDDLFRLPKI